MVWNYFKKVHSNVAVCDVCGEKISCKGGSTSAMQNHLKLRHPLNLVAGRSGAGSSSGSGNSLITGYFSTKTVVMDRAKKEEYRNKLAMMCIQDLLPIDFVKGKGFRSVAEFLYPGLCNTTTKLYLLYISKCTCNVMLHTLFLSNINNWQYNIIFY